MNKHSSHATSPVRVVSLFSGGLDSILAAKVMQRQGIEVLGLHFVTPFFGSKDSLAYWQRQYGIHLQAVDVGEDFLAMLMRRPARGFGKVLNPCVDCKVLMMRHAKRVMQEIGAVAIVSGEVLGQRPMSQRTETLNSIVNDAEVKGLLLRPLSAKLLQPTQAELEGDIDREQLYAFSGRGRKDQLALAQELGIRPIPTPAGGCKLTETEKARNYWKILTCFDTPQVTDFTLSDGGRQFWSPRNEWFIIGRNKKNNELLQQYASPDDYLFRLEHHAGPIGLVRHICLDTLVGQPGQMAGAEEEEIREEGGGTPDDKQNRTVFEELAALMATYSPKAMQAHAATGAPVEVRVHQGSLADEGFVVTVLPDRKNTDFIEARWEDVREEKKAEARARFMDQAESQPS